MVELMCLIKCQLKSNLSQSFRDSGVYQIKNQQISIRFNLQMKNNYENYKYDIKCKRYVKFK